MIFESKIVSLHNKLKNGGKYDTFISYHSEGKNDNPYS